MATEFQEKLYAFIEHYLREYKTSPSFSTITAAMNISPRSKSLITKSLRALEKAGQVVLKKDGRRLQINLSSKQIPLLGRISAGNPIEAISEQQFINIDETFQVDNRFALQVQGDSMIDEGILDGDIIICRHAETASEGAIVVALIDQTNTTLKRISYKAPGLIMLVPANKTLKPKAYAPERIRIQGIYIGLIRAR